MDGGHALKNVQMEKRRDRNGATYPRLQHESCDEDHWNPGISLRDESLKNRCLVKTVSRPNLNAPNWLRNGFPPNLTIIETRVVKKSSQSLTQKRAQNLIQFPHSLSA